MKNLIDKLKKCRNFFEKSDPNPTGIPLNFKRPPTLQEQVQAMIHSERFKEHINRSGYETIDEAEDFDTGEPGANPESEHELVYDEDLEKEIPKAEKRQLDRQRRDFDRLLQVELAKKRAAKKEAAPAAKKKPKEADEE